MKKVLFTGTISSGKSTLITALQNKLPHDVVVVQQVARYFREEHARQSGTHLVEDEILQKIFFSQQTAFEQAAALYQPDLIICDGGVLDNIAYARLFSQSIKTEWIEWCRSYDSIFFFDKRDVPFTVRPRPPLTPPDWLTFRNNLEDQLKHALHHYHLPYYFISGTPEERLTQLESYLL